LATEIWIRKGDKTVSAESGNYWLTEDGILARLGMLSEDVQLGTFNNAVKIYGTALGVTDFVISGDVGPNSCLWCIDHIGQSYHRGQFMPDLPKHINCIHFYDIERIGSLPE
jgi:hypothetical protein